MRLSASLLMFLLLLAACDSQHGQFPYLKPESSRLDPSTDFGDLVDLNQSLPSPSGQYVLSAYSFPPGDRASTIILRLTNPQGIHLDSFVTQQSAKQSWALGWHQGEDTVVLQTSTGTTVYNIISPGAIRLMECPQPVYGETGLRLMQTKYPHLEVEKAELPGTPEA